MRYRAIAKVAAVLFVSFAAARAETPQQTYEAALKAAQEAFAAENFSAAAASLDAAQSYRPYSLFLTRNRILARFLSGDKAGALAIAEKVAARGLALDFPATEEFDRLRADAAFASVLKAFEENARPKGTAEIVAAISESSLLPEAAIKGGEAVLIGSVRTGAVVEAQASSLRTISKLEGGVFDLALSVDGKRLHAAVNNQLAYENAGARPAEAAVVTIDRRSGAVISRIALDDGAALLGDLEADRGVLYASDSLTPRLVVFRDIEAPETLAADPRFVNLQGLALDRKKQRLYVADYLAGLFAVDLKTRQVRQIANPSDAHLGGIDGLYLYKGDLIGVQNGTTPQRIVRIDLDKKGATAHSLTVLQQALPEWNEPTHGFVDGDRFIYIATSNWPAYDDAGKVRDGAVLRPLRLMAIDLN